MQFGLFTMPGAPAAGELDAPRTTVTSMTSFTRRNSVSTNTGWASTTLAVTRTSRCPSC